MCIYIYVCTGYRTRDANSGPIPGTLEFSVFHKGLFLRAFSVFVLYLSRRYLRQQHCGTYFGSCITEEPGEGPSVLSWQPLVGRFVWNLLQRSKRLIEREAAD